MLNRVGWVRVFVSDMDRAVDFYENKVGIKVRNRSLQLPEFVELATEGTILALSSVGDERPEGKRLVGRPTGIILTVPDIQKTHSSLSSKGCVSRGRRPDSPGAGS